ncbi:hypothetical protein RRG08_065075 [Elysia crispata]|uniref:Uncharacterized protein n=1 Tax=Elysia crispata TaxID=231223 RepID=A0AAE0ZN93_9GAST|nr:hypothetical protein RRG08_065075 [Elysia crispata]
MSHVLHASLAPDQSRLNRCDIRICEDEAKPFMMLNKCVDKRAQIKLASITTPGRWRHFGQDLAKDFGIVSVWFLKF